ncbi:helix-turn-helix transcriptional regulator [Promicromonospora sp. NPDC023805]|uniref:helix-turn-helix domain-containing protein n=1 Tax=Promicromonospora sp. NPDC023805 TaxID=3154696 RepID=UPI0033FFBE4E
MNDDESIGRRIAHYRKTRGITQVALAQHASISLSLLRKVEQGTRDATPVLIAAVSKPLDVEVTVLTGQPYGFDGRRPDRIHALMPGLRRALAYWDLPPETHTPPRTRAEITADAREISRLRQSDRHVQIAERLPALLLETATAVHREEGTERERYFEIMAVLLFAAHSVTYKTGYQDLSTVIEERLQWSAIQSADPLMGALAAWSRTTSLLRTGAYDVGLRLLDRVQSQIATADDLATISMRGPLHLRSAILAARAGNTGTVDTHLDEARQISARLGADTDGGWHQLSFGPSNVAIHDVAAAIELGDGARALGRAENVRLSSAVPAIRAGHHYMDLARAYLWQNRNEQALASLQQARKVAPQQTRHHPTTREVLRMLTRAHRHANEPLVRFNAWVGTDANG